MTDPSQGVPRSTRRAGRPHRTKWLSRFLGGVLALVLAVGGSVAWAVGPSLNSIKHEDLLPDRHTNTTAGSGDLTFLVTGVDTVRGHVHVVNDLAFLVKVPAARDKVYVTALPGGQVPPRTSIDHAVRIELSGIVGLIDQLGGVTVKNKVTLRSGHYYWPKREIKLSGAAALAYVRLTTGGETARRERQLAVVQGLVGKLFSRDVLTNPLRLQAVVSQLAPYVTLDKQLTNGVLLGIITSMKLRSSADIVLTSNCDKRNWTSCLTKTRWPGRS